MVPSLVASATSHISRPWPLLQPSIFSRTTMKLMLTGFAWPIIKISETRSGFHSQDRTSMCIYIHRRTLKKLLSACVRALNLVLIPINDENDTEYTCFDSKTIADEEAELNYVIDIAKPTLKSKNVRMIHIFMETMSNETVTYSLESVLKEIKDSIKEVNQKIDTFQQDVNQKFLIYENLF